MVYLDDILIYSSNLSEHWKLVKEILQWLKNNSLYTFLDKYVFYQNSVEFLGYVLGPEGVEMDSEKVQTIQTWPKPHYLKNIQVFLGFANFYRRFIDNYSDLILSLTYLTHKNTNWNWNIKCDSVFKLLKATFTTTLVLAHWDPELPLVLETDTSDHTVAVIWSTHIKEDLHPIVFYSRTLNATELNYDIYNKKLLTIYKAFQK